MTKWSGLTVTFTHRSHLHCTVTVWVGVGHRFHLVRVWIQIPPCSTPLPIVSVVHGIIPFLFPLRRIRLCSLCKEKLLYFSREFCEFFPHISDIIIFTLFSVFLIGILEFAMLHKKQMLLYFALHVIRRTNKLFFMHVSERCTCIWIWNGTSVPNGEKWEE